MSSTAIALIHARTVHLTSKQCMQQQRLSAYGMSTTNALIYSETWLGRYLAWHLPKAMLGGLK